MVQLIPVIFSRVQALLIWVQISRARKQKLVNTSVTCCALYFNRNIKRTFAIKTFKL